MSAHVVAPLQIVVVVETAASVSVLVPGFWNPPGEEIRRVAYQVEAGTPEEAQNVVANRIHRAMLGFPQDPDHEGGGQ